MEDLLSKIDELKEVIRKTPGELLHERIYICVANLCNLLTVYKYEKGVKGWSGKFVDELQQPVLNSKQQESLEATFSGAPWIMKLFEEERPSQKGGDAAASAAASEAAATATLPTLQPGLLVSDMPEPTTSEMMSKVSLDEFLHSLSKKSAEWDETFSKIANESPGFVKKINSQADILIYGVPIPVKLILTLLMSLLDILRMSISLHGGKSNILTLIVFIEELVTGQWRQALLTSSGFISPSGVALSVVGKYIVNAWMLISPEIRTQLYKDVIKGGKSAALGLLLWLATVLPPKAVREATEKALEDAKKLTVGTLDTAMEKIKESGSKALAPLHKHIEFNNLDLDNLRKISFQDIQNLQSLAQWNLIVCSSEFQGIVGNLQKNPIFRLILELLNIPTVQEDKDALCPRPYVSIVQKVQEELKPVIVDDGLGEAAALPSVPLPSVPLPSVPLPSAPLPSVPLPSVPLPSAPLPSAPLPSAPLPSVPLPSAVAPLVPPVTLPVAPPAPAPLPSPLPVAKGGKRKQHIVKLKKSTRFRKSTPRRETRRV
jgi:hypothetical protein